MKSITVSLLLLAIFFSVNSLSAQTPASEKSSLREKIGTMLVMGFKGQSFDAKNIIAEDIKKRRIGGVILFEHNITPVTPGKDSKAILSKMCKDLQEYADYNLLISIDQEGGRVNRLKSKYGFPASVQQKYLGEINNEDSTRSYAASMAKALKAAGFNVNFAPDTDVDINPKCPVIGAMGRSFSSDADIVTNHSLYVIDEHHKQKVLTSLKHFPGHGSSKVDSHLGFTDISETWSISELEPFANIIDAGMCDMVMVGHMFNDKIDEKHPASLSEKTIQELLRDKMGWDGVVITDDMHMGAIAKQYSMKEALALSINAGVDMLIYSRNITGETDSFSEKVVSLVEELVNEGVISQQRIDQAYERVCRMRNSMNTLK